MPSITIDHADPQRHLEQEWLLTNGLGGYAMGSVPGGNTRRYHGLLVAATKPPLGRIVALHSTIEQLSLPRDDGSEEVLELSTQQFGESLVLHPGGLKRLLDVCIEPDRVQWHWRQGDVHAWRELRLRPNPPMAILTYRVQAGGRPWALRVRPMIALRGIHDVMHRQDEGFRAATEPEALVISRGDARLAIRAASAAWQNEPQWWERFAYAEDRARGLEWLEDAWSPGTLTFRARADRLVSIECSLPSVPRPRIGFRTHAPPTSGGERRGGRTRMRLVDAANAMVVERWQGNGAHASIIAGYPWFADWGRDAMISLPGLLLCTGRFEVAKSCLDLFAAHVRHGLIPNCFHEQSGEPEYNSVDAPLWFIHAVREYVRFSGDQAIPGLLEACRGIIRAFRRGTRFGIGLCADGLVAAGSEATQLTWMDASRDGVVFTPRHGKPVEVNALWHNALLALAELVEAGDADEAAEYRERAGHTALSMQMNFWWPERSCLHDVLLPDNLGDGRLRPNQIFAVSLPHSPLTMMQRRAVVETVRERLLTPFGLRTLDPEDPEYRGRFEGSLFERDRAYHQGTVWPWLIGPYCEAVLRINDFSEAATMDVRAVLAPLLRELDRKCIGHLCEVYDGEAPHRPGGCIAQAWSVAEVLRIMTLIDR